MGAGVTDVMTSYETVKVNIEAEETRSCLPDTDFPSFKNNQTVTSHIGHS